MSAKVYRQDNEDDSVLRQYIERLQRADAVLSYQQLLGLLYAISCAPEEIKASEWFELIWLNDDPQFDGEAEAKAFFRLLIDLQKRVANSLDRGLPFPAQYDEGWHGDLAQWCQGFLLGHQYLEELWVVAVGELADESTLEAIDSCLNLVATFADIEAARQQLIEDGEFLSDDQLPEAYLVLRKSLATYLDTGRCAQGLSPLDVEQLFQRLEPVAKDEYCPCGSGLLFKQCCLH